MSAVDTERAKYEAMADVNGYHDISPGERFVEGFLAEVQDRLAHQAAVEAAIERRNALASC
jgi:hypothetical protein